MMPRVHAGPVCTTSPLKISSRTFRAAVPLLRATVALPCRDDTIPTDWEAAAPDCGEASCANCCGAAGRGQMKRAAAASVRCAQSGRAAGVVALRIGGRDSERDGVGVRGHGAGQHGCQECKTAAPAHDGRKRGRQIHADPLAPIRSHAPHHRRKTWGPAHEHCLNGPLEPVMLRNPIEPMALRFSAGSSASR